MSDKIRIRTEEELDLQSKGLQELGQMLDQLDLTWYICGGTMLGAVRDKDFIKWDWDVGVALLHEEMEPGYDRLKESLVRNGFEIKKEDLRKNNLKITAEKYRADFEISAWYKEGDYRMRKGLKRPAHFFEEPGEVELRGHTYPAPAPQEEFLEFVYGDWRTPKRTADKEEYFNEQNLRGGRLMRELKRLYRRFVLREY